MLNVQLSVHAFLCFIVTLFYKIINTAYKFLPQMSVKPSQIVGNNRVYDKNFIHSNNMNDINTQLKVIFVFYHNVIEVEYYVKCKKLNSLCSYKLLITKSISVYKKQSCKIVWVKLVLSNHLFAFKVLFVYFSVFNNQLKV